MSQPRSVAGTLRFMWMRTRISVALFAISTALQAAPETIRATPESLPSHIELEITAVECSPPDERGESTAIWYATVRARVEELAGGVVDISVLLRDEETDEFLFNPGSRTIIENGYALSSIAFDSRILDQVVFRWRETGTTIYEIYLRDFYSGNRC